MSLKLYVIHLEINFMSLMNLQEILRISIASHNFVAKVTPY
jgi:hypothetical protein